VAFAARLGPIRGVRPGVVPPKTARTLAESITARSKLIAPRFPSTVSNKTCSFGQTSSRVHSLKRRQHVLPLPQFISLGKACQGIPVLRTKITPASAWRSDTRGRPPLGEGLNFGSNGSMCFHSLSDTSSAMRRPPCSTQWRKSTEILAF
jgi:hypothetical protein